MEDSKDASAIMHRTNRYYKNRYFIFFLYSIIASITGSVSFNWVGIQEILYKAGSFEDLCSSVPDAKYVLIGGAKVIDCAARKVNINTLSTICYATRMLFAFLGGFMVDFLGPQKCFLISHFMCGFAWSLIFVFTKNPLALRIGFFMIGLFYEAHYLSTVVTSCDMFPRNRSTVVSILAALRCVSYFVPPLMSFFYDDKFVPYDQLYIIGIVYLAVGHGFAFAIGFNYVPVRRLALERMDSDVTSPVVAGGEDVAVVVASSDSNVSSIGASHTIERSSKSNLGVFLRVRLGSIGYSAKSLAQLLQAAFKHVQLLEYALLLTSTTIFIAAIEFLTKACRELLTTRSGETAIDIFKYTNFLTFLPGPFLGYLMDQVGPAIVLWILHLANLFYYIFTYIDTLATKVMACFAYIVSGSLCVSAVYCYVENRFPKQYFGTLSAAVFFVCGCFSLLSIPLYNYGVQTKGFDLTWFSLIMIGYMSVACTLSGLLIYITKKRIPVPPHELKIKPESSHVD